MKRCTKCRTEHPLNMFARDRSRADGLQLICKDCQRSYREANKIHLSEANKAWKAANPEKVIANRQRFRAKPDVVAKCAAYNKAWKAANPEKIREQTRRRYARHAEELRQKARKAREADPDGHRERCRLWRIANRDQIAEYRRVNRQQDRDYYARNADLIREKKEARLQWCVYRILFSDGCFYLGSSCHYDLRFNAHKSLARRSKHVAALNNRRLETAEVVVLSVCSSEQEALDQEAAAITKAMVDCPGTCLNTAIPTKPCHLFWVYVIQSLAARTDKQGNRKPGFFYVGMTTDPSRRLREHNGVYADGAHGNPNGGKYTATRRPWKAAALFGPYTSRSEALKAEYALKRQKRGEGRLRWSREDSPLCRGEGPSHPWVSDPSGWRPPKSD